MAFDVCIVRICYAAQNTTHLIVVGIERPGAFWRADPLLQREMKGFLMPLPVMFRAEGFGTKRALKLSCAHANFLVGFLWVGSSPAPPPAPLLEGSDRAPGALGECRSEGPGRGRGAEAAGRRCPVRSSHIIVSDIKRTVHTRPIVI